jgi:hypothetical protein
MGKMENVAVGEKQGIAKLQFPEDATWLGTVVESEGTALEQAHRLASIEVPLITLDQYVLEKKLEPDLIKIDTEGNEINVLAGEIDLLLGKRPFVIFESNNSRDRKDIWNFLNGTGYRINDLPFRKGEMKAGHTPDEFINSGNLNFIAIPGKI